MALKFKLVVNIEGKSKTIINSTEERFNKNIAVAKEKGYTIEKKCKLYPVGNWYKYQHVFYNANDRAWNYLHDAQESGNKEEIDKAYENLEMVQHLLDVFDGGYKDSNGMVYAEYQDYKRMKDTIGAYACRHNGYV